MSRHGLNLLKLQVEPPTVWTKLYDWIVSTSRIVVIVVELLVVAAFAIRLVVDIQSKFLDREIETKETVMSQWREEEARFRKIQDKTKAFETSWILSTAYTEIFVEINKYIPKNSTELSVQIDREVINISGEATNLEVGNLETALKNNNFFQNTEVKQIQSSNSNPQEIAQFSISTKVRNIKSRSIADTGISSTSLLNK
ncbi:MAG TPA: PilN domain-containing protein [Candidatus Dojkabacteria bacterium]|nr:PilN domain-containing protein [Candidatus Dojkabacteria bacterium]